MSRKAILIEASKIKNHPDLPGARADVANYKSYLESAFGGAWNSDEIVTLNHPTKASLIRTISSLQSLDYTFIAFSGHGHHVVGQGLNETRVCINDTEEVAVRDLNAGNYHSLIIADCCRNITVLESVTKALKMAFEQARAVALPDRRRCRDLFDKSVDEAERGPIYMYSCNLKESAGESSSGGVFSLALVEVGGEWAKNTYGSAVLRTDSAFRGAAELTNAKNRQQNPQHEPGRRLTHFPFAVFA